MLAQAGDLRSMARELGISASPEASGAAALAPAVLGSFENEGQVLGGGGQAGAGTASSGLAPMLEIGGDGNLLGDIPGMTGR